MVNSKTRRPSTRVKPPLALTCHFCPAWVESQTHAHKWGWDWFTGRLPATVHVCPSCQDQHRREVFDLKTKAYAS
jgi:hypothetical protein